MPQVDPELAELAQNPRIPVDVLAAAQFTSRQLSEHWQACTSGAHYHVAVALVDATTGRMAVHLAADGALSPISGHLASWDRSVRHAAARLTMEQSGLSVDIDRASLVSLTTIDHIDADHQAEHHEFGVLWERASAVRADLAERIVWLPLTELICSSDARVANLAAVTREHLSSQPVLRSTTRR